MFLKYLSIRGKILPGKYILNCSIYDKFYLCLTIKR